MKKILSFFVAGALALGLIGCSGDLHDYEANEECIGLYLAGDIQADKDNRAKLKFVDETTQTYAFTYDSSKMTYWGGSKGTINFKLVTDATTWTQDFGWKKDTPVVIDLNGDFLTLQARDAANSNPGNIKVENLIDGKEYVITVNYDAPNKVAKVKIAGPAIDFPTLKVVTDKIEGGNPVEYPLTREGTTYKYIWTPTESGSFKFYVTNGYMYYGKDGKIDSEKPDTDDYVEVTYEAGEEYAIVIETAYDKGSNVTIEAGIYDTSILAKADIIGGFDDWKGSKLTRVDDTTYTFEFKNAGENVEFAIREKAGDWTVGRWFKGIPEDTAERKKTDMADDIVAAKYGTTAAPVVLTYYKGDAGNDGRNAVIKGMPFGVGHTFKVTIKIVDADSKKVSVACEPTESIPDSEYDPAKFDSCYKLNNINYVCSSHGSYKISWGSKQADGSYIGTVTVPSGAENTWNSPCFEFGVTDTTSWGTKFVDAELKTTETYVALTKGGKNNNKISSVTGKLAKDLTITLLSTADKISAKYTY